MNAAVEERIANPQYNSVPPTNSSLTRSHTRKAAARAFWNDILSHCRLPPNACSENEGASLSVIRHYAGQLHQPASSRPPQEDIEWALQELAPPLFAQIVPLMELFIPATFHRGAVIDDSANAQPDLLLFIVEGEAALRLASHVSASRLKERHDATPERIRELLTFTNLGTGQGGRADCRGRDAD